MKQLSPWLGILIGSAGTCWMWNGIPTELNALRRDVNNLLTELYGEIDSLYENLQEHGGAA
jgi:hypothetical protein